MTAYTNPAAPLTTNNDIADKLDEARALIERGWIQGEFANGERTCFCIIGAINQVVGGDAEAADIYLLADQACGLVARVTDVGSVAIWNDDSQRQQSEVVEALRKAADLARAEQVQL